MPTDLGSETWLYVLLAVWLGKPQMYWQHKITPENKIMYAHRGLSGKEVQVQNRTHFVSCNTITESKRVTDTEVLVGVLT